MTTLDGFCDAGSVKAEVMPDRNAGDAKLRALMKAAIEGDKAAYASLLKDLSNVLRRKIVWGLNGVNVHRDDVEDVVQDVLLTIHLKRHTWNADLPLLPWVFAIARNKMMDFLRKNYRHRAVPIETQDLEGPDQQASTDALDVASVLSSLSSRNREIVRAIKLEGADAGDVAKSFGMSEVGVRVALHRSMKSLASVYQ